MSITFCEQINMKKLTEVINCNNIPTKNSDDAHWSSKVLPSILKKIAENLVEIRMGNALPNTFKLSTTYTQKIPNFGRLFSDIGLQRINNEIKCYISGEYYYDIDIKNAHPVFINEVFKKFEVHNEFINEYTTDREATMKKYKLYNKKSLLYIINSDTLNSRYINTRIETFHKKLYELFNERIIKSNKQFYRELKKSIITKLKKEKEPEENICGKMMAVYLQNIENTCLNSILQFLEERDIIVDVLMFDGCMVSKEYQINPELLEDCSNYVSEKSDYPIKLALKPMETDWYPEYSEEIIEAPLYILTDNFSIHVLRRLCEKYWIYDINGKHVGIESDCPELIDYMNIYFAQFQHPISYAFRNNRRDRYRFIKGDDITHLTKSCGKITYPASHMYTKHIDSIVYDKTDFIINFHVNDVINEMWEDTNVSKGLTVYNLYQRPESISHPDVLSRASIIFDFILTVICDSNQELYEFILKWIAYILQNGKSGIALVLMGDFGCGKGTFSQLLIAIFGLEYTYTDVCGSRIESRFNGHEEGNTPGYYGRIIK